MSAHSLEYWTIQLHALADYLAAQGRAQPGLSEETRGRYYSAAAEVRVAAARLEMLKETT